MNRYNAQILNDKGEYHLQFETDNKEHFDAVEKIVQKCIDNKPLTNFDLITQSEESLAKFTGQFARVVLTALGTLSANSKERE